MKLKRIGVLSFGIFQGVFAGFVGLIMAIFMKIASNVLAPSMINAEELGLVEAFTFGAAVWLVVQMLILGFLVGIVFALIYNFIARWTGGVEIELHK